jgi:energy-coupling factor transporter ATP-binding protein EcfA2
VRLDSLQLAGYRRFSEPTTIRLHTRATAVIGPNESGKSSLLDAFEDIGREGWGDDGSSAFTDRLVPGDPDEHTLSARFLVERADVDAVDAALEGRRVQGEVTVGLTCTLFKDVDGVRVWNMERIISRDLSLRAELRQAATQTLEAGVPELGDEDGEALEEAFRRFVDALTVVGVSLPKASIEAIGALRDALQERADDSPMAEEFRAWWRERLEALEAEESAEDPYRVAWRVLFQRLPDFLKFGPEQRTLPTFNPFDREPPAALRNLCGAGQVDYDEIRELALQPSGRERLRDIVNAANQRLEGLFREWSQRTVTVALSVDSQGITVLGRDRNAPLLDAPFEQRSEGMRIFAALLAFVHSAGVKSGSAPVLLLDEAEQHLHYDAQADLVRILGSQRAAQKVIYTTHSIGCLPEDLGLGVVVVDPVGHERSALSQSFWTGGPGLHPIMMALGATALAFTPARRVLIGEGAHEAIILPTLLRHSRPGVAPEEPLGFQIVGGISEVHPKDADRLEEEAGTVLYLVDSDGGGRAHARKLPKAAHDAGRVLRLGADQSSIEDFVAVPLLLEAANALLARQGNRMFKPLKRDIPVTGRAQWIMEALRHRGSTMSRTLLAQEVVIRAADAPAIVEKARTAELRALLDKIYGHFPAL